MRTAVVAAVALLLAGCTDAPAGPDGPCAHEECASPPPDDLPVPPPPRGTDLRIPEARYPVFQMQRCEDFRVALEVPRAAVAPLIPDAFEAFSGVGPAMVGVLVRFAACDRSLDNSTVFGPTTMYTVLVRVLPTNDTWTDDGWLNFYVLEEATDNAAWKDKLGNVSRPLDQAAFDITRAELPGGSLIAQLGASTSAWATQLEFPRVAYDNPQALEYDLHLWYGDGPFHRVTHHEKGNSSGLPAQATLRASGDSSLAQALQAPATAYYIGNHLTDKNVLFQYDGAWQQP